MGEDLESDMYQAPVSNEPRKAPPAGLNKLLDSVPRATNSEKKMRKDQAKLEQRKAQALAVNARMAAATTDATPSEAQPQLTSPTKPLAPVPALAPPPEDTTITINSPAQDESSDDDIYADEEL